MTAPGRPPASRLVVALVWFAALPATLGLAELGLRGLRGGGHAALPIYASVDPPSLRRDVDAIGLLGPRSYRVHLDSRGLRAPAPERGTVLLGDSLAFGLGLDDEDTLAARCSARGHPVLDAAAPSFSTVDALARGEALVPLATDFLVVVNPWDDGLPALRDTAVVVDGWLLRRDAPAWLQALVASPIGGWQLTQDAARIAALVKPAQLARSGWPSAGAALRTFVAAHPDTRVVWGGYPTATMPDGRDVATERAALAAVLAPEPAVPLLDLHLTDAWLDGDLHWSAAGVEQVAAQLCGPPG